MYSAVDWHREQVSTSMAAGGLDELTISWPLRSALHESIPTRPSYIESKNTGKKSLACQGQSVSGISAVVEINANSAT